MKTNPTNIKTQQPEKLDVEISNELIVEPFINKPVVAHRIGQTTRAVELMMRRGLPYYKLGSRTAFRWSEIQAYLVQTCRVCHQK